MIFKFIIERTFYLGPLFDLFAIHASKDINESSTFIVARGSIAFHNTETSVLLSLNDLLCIGPIKSRQTLIVSIVGMNALLLLLMGIHTFLYFNEKRHSYRKRLPFKIKCEQQDDQCQANDTPVETVCFVENPKNWQPSYEPVWGKCRKCRVSQNLRRSVQCQKIKKNWNLSGVQKYFFHSKKDPENSWNEQLCRDLCLYFFLWKNNLQCRNFEIYHQIDHYKSI